MAPKVGRRKGETAKGAGKVRNGKTTPAFVAERMPAYRKLELKDCAGLRQRRSCLRVCTYQQHSQYHGANKLDRLHQIIQ